MERPEGWSRPALCVLYTMYSDWRLASNSS
jgi:hypothetical protein